MSERVQAVADAAQAAYFRLRLVQERSDLAAMLGKHTKSLTQCMTERDMRPTSDIRRHIRTIERELQSIDRMVEALDDRFPDEAATTESEPTRRRA
jgi:DNA-binding transcriptional MocR family regulator